MTQRYHVFIRLLLVAFVCGGLMVFLLLETNQKPVQVGATLTFHGEAPRAEPPDEDNKKMQNPKARAELEYTKLHDPATGDIPYERLWTVIETEITQAALFDRPATVPATTFTERGPTNIGGRTRALVWDPDVSNKVWAGGVSGGLWFTLDITTDGTTWTKVDDFWENLAVTALAYDPSTSGASRVYYAGTGEGVFNVDAVTGAGIFKSTNAGSSWTQLSSTSSSSSFQFIQDIVVTSGGVVLAATRDGVQRSTDGGSNWTKVLAASGATSTSLTNFANDLEIASNGTIYAGMGLIFSGSCDGVYASTDNGATWTKETLPGTCDYRRVEVAVAPGDANTIYVATHDASTNGVNHVFKTTDGGTNWSSATVPTSAGTQAWYDLILAVDPNNANTVWLGVVQMNLSTDGGSTWTQQSSSVLHVDHHAVAYKPGSSTEIAFGNDGGVYYTSTATSAAASKSGAAAAVTYIDRNDNYNITQYYGGDISPTSGSNVMIAGAQDNSTHLFSSAGVGSVTAPSPLNCCDGGFAYIDQDNANVMLGSVQNGSYSQSTDGGSSFSSLFNATGISPLFINPGDLDDTNDLFYGTFSTTQFFVFIGIGTGSISFGTVTVSGMSDEPSTFTVSPRSTTTTSSTVFLGTQNGKVYKCTLVVASKTPTGSVSCSDISGGSFPGSNVSNIAIGASDNELLVTFSNFGVNSVWESEDGGSTWLDRDDNNTLPDIPVRAALYDPNNTNRVLLGTDAGMYGTSDIDTTTPTWTRDTSIPLTRVEQFQYRTSDGTIMAITHGRGVWTGAFNTVLPVELASFEVLQTDQDVILQWQTASETNNSGFQVEQARGASDQFEQVAFVNGQGTTTETQTYQLRLSDLSADTYRFRLKQVDFDGTFTYSEHVEVAVELPDAFQLTEVYPNPFATEARFELTLKVAQDVRVEVYDATGRRLSQLHQGPLSAQRHSFQLDGNTLASGTYLVRVTGETFQATKTATLVR